MINRRNFLKTIGAGLTAFGLSRKSSAGDLLKNNLMNVQVETQKNYKHNLLVIHCDELTFRMLGCYRQILPEDQTLMWGPQAKIDTPNIDWIASNGAICKNFYANSPICSPSRGSFVSGKYPQNSPVKDNNIKLSENTVTFAGILAGLGFSTGYCGKWHLDGPPKPGFYPRDNFGFEDNRYMWNRGHGKKIVFRDPSAKFASGMGDQDTFPTDFLTARTIEFIETNKDKPFCYMVSFPDPHGPDRVRTPYDNMYDNLDYQRPETYDKVRPLPSWAAPANAALSQSTYLGMIKCIDDNIGKILQILRDENLIEKTIIVFTADHGDLRGEYRRQDKCVPMDGSAKIPFALYYPGKIKPGTIVNHTLACIDFLPTILSLMGAPTAKTEEGRDTSQFFLTGQAPKDWKDIAFMRGRSQAPDKKKPLDLWVAAVTMNHKLVLSEVETDGPWLIDLEKNPVDELAVNYIDDPDYADVKKHLAQEMLDYGQKYNDPRVQMSKIQAELNNLITS